MKDFLRGFVPKVQTCGWKNHNCSRQAAKRGGILIFYLSLQPNQS